MKRLIVFLFVLCFSSPFVFAKEEEVYLDLNIPEIHKYNTGKVEFGNQKSNYYDYEDEDYTKPSLLMIKKMYDEEFRPDKKTPKKK